VSEEAAPAIEFGLKPPPANPELFGHREAERTLFDAWSSGRLPHAWLITGPRGIGKATLAYRFARFVLAGAGHARTVRDLSVDPEHPVARRIAAGSHPDLAVLQRGYPDDRERLRAEIVVDDARGIVDFLHLTPAEGGWRVAIIDAADEMNRNAANAMLKVIEEPRGTSLLLLVCHAPGRLPATIRSRCCRLPLRPLPPADFEPALGRGMPGLDPEARRFLVCMAEGSLGRAMAIAESGGHGLAKAILEQIASLPELDSFRLHDFAERATAGGGDAVARFRLLAELLGWWLARLTRVAATGVMPADAIAGEGEILRRVARIATPIFWAEARGRTLADLAAAEALKLDRRQTLVQAMWGLTGRPAGA
jgi:DNA polymerase III subunit delta'